MKSVALTTLLLLPFFLTLVQCHSEKKTAPAPKLELSKHHFSAPHLGTLVHLVFYTEQREQAEQLAERCFQRIKELDAIFSDYRPDSEVSKLCLKPIGQAHKVSHELFTVIAYAQTISAKSEGAFDITLGTHTKRWRRRSEAQQDQINYQHLKLDPEQKSITLEKPLSIDLGGIGKGYIVDQLMLLVKDAGIIHAAVIIGGETVIAAAPPGKKGWSIGIENPEKQLIGSLLLENTALSTSGDSYQYFEVDGKRHSHLIDPSTKQSKINRLNVTTIAPTAMQADGFATALRILSIDNALLLAQTEPALEALFSPHNAVTLKTKQFPELIELKKTQH